MPQGTTKKKVKATLRKTESELFNSKTSDIAKVETITNIDSTVIQSISMTRIDEDVTRCQVSVMFQGSFRKDGTFLNVGSIYIYDKVDISAWTNLRSQALRGNSMGKAIGKYLKADGYSGTWLKPSRYIEGEFSDAS